MYLKRLEIHGFKSFADKITLDFTQGLSVVVGPNGSGKSNISDAIRWVIGEQSAKSLRGTKMEDIIFAGSAKRRPVGMAEVSLTLDNSTGIFPLGFQEITVTRRVYRSGESDYLINKASCRLKDVHELFMDTGIGRDGLSIIGQGRVEEILSAKPEERRGLIEEVAGITKYRNRKKEATRKLEETEQNLQRLADIIGELACQMGPLQEQAATACQYLGFKQELDAAELNLAVHDIDTLSTTLSENRAEITHLQNSVVTAETALGVADADSITAKLAVQTLDEQIYHEQEHCHVLASNIQQMESELKLCAERSALLGEQQAKLDSGKTEIEGKFTSLQSEFQVEETKLLILQSTRQELEQQLQAEEGRLHAYNQELGSSEHQLENMKTEVFDLLAAVAKHNNELAGLQQQVESRNYRQQALHSQVELKHEELTVLEQDCAEVGAAQLGLRQTANDVVTQLNELEHAQNMLGKQSDTIQTERDKVREALQAANSRLKILQDMQRDFEGYNRGVKEVLRAAQIGRLEGICGVVAELLQVPARFETAMEVALGGNLQNLVTLTEKDAKAAIAMLKNQKFGRATLLPLDALSAAKRGFEAKVLNSPGVLGVAADLVEYDAKYKEVAEYLLGKILVVETLEQATQVARTGGYRLRIVTLEGEVLSPGGSMTGGSLQQRSTSLLGRAREISTLSDTVAQLNINLTALNAQDTLLNESLQESRGTQQKLQEKLKQLELDLVALENTHVSIAQNKARLEQELATLGLEIEQVVNELAAVSERYASIAEQRDSVQADYTRVTDSMGKAQAELKDQGASREQLQVAITGLKVKIAGLEQEEKGMRAALERYYRQKDEFRVELAELSRQQTDLTERQRAIGGESEGLRERLAQLVQTENVAQRELINLRQDRQILTEKLAALEQELKNLRRELQQRQEKLHGLQVQEARLDTEIKGAFTKLEENLGITLATARLQSQPVTNRREATGQINRLKAQISTLGTVNLGAVDEFARVEERFTFLSTQQQDLLQAKESLFNVIAEVDQIMVERFHTNFLLVKANFAAVFVELFGGGRAELELTQPDNLLETGIEIIVQPPGKKLQHLSLLSGGEKALTAIALLFGMLRVKPSPFCVLDEIEAALDETNVNRFASFLQELGSTNQFVVISHRKGTMEAADVLFGITMEETGVSKIYAVKMVETADAASMVG